MLNSIEIEMIKMFNQYKITSIVKLYKIISVVFVYRSKDDGILYLNIISNRLVAVNFYYSIKRNCICMKSRRYDLVLSVLICIRIKKKHF